MSTSEVLQVRQFEAFGPLHVKQFEWHCWQFPFESI